MISVCMATYNGESYIEMQIDSILANLSEADELIISDDGSSDRTKEIISRYTSCHPSVILIQGPQKGVISNFENAIMRASGDYIFLADQDDIWDERKVETVMCAFDDSNADVIVHDAIVVDGSGKTLAPSFFSIRSSRKGFLKNIVRNSYIGCCIAFDSRLKEVLLPFPSGIEMHDWWIGLIGELSGSTLFIPDKLISYRRHGANVSRDKHYPITRMVRNRANILVALSSRMLYIGVSRLHDNSHSII